MLVLRSTPILRNAAAVLLVRFSKCVAHSPQAYAAQNSGIFAGNRGGVKPGTKGDTEPGVSIGRDRRLLGADERQTDSRSGACKGESGTLFQPRQTTFPEPVAFPKFLAKFLALSGGSRPLRVACPFRNRSSRIH